jgi:hypothetical protein
MEILTFFLQAAGSAVLTVLAFVGLAPTKLGLESFELSP